MTNKEYKKPLFMTMGFKAAEINEDNEKLKIEGFANTTSKDRQGDVILEDAWKNGALSNYLKNPIVLAFHNAEKPIGEVVEHSITSAGLHVVAEISKASGEIYNLIREGVLKAFSVGFKVGDADYDTETDIFVIKQLELFEISVVSIPASPDSIFSIQKSLNEEEYLEFKNLYNKNQEDAIKIAEPDIGEENEMDKDKISITTEELKKLEKDAVDKAMAKKAADEARAAQTTEVIKNVSTEVVSTAEERILQEVEKRLTEKESTLEETLEGLRADLKEKNDEIIAMNKSKMEFVTDSSKKAIISDTEKETAVLAAKIMGVPLDSTKYFKDVITKAGGAHVQSLGGLDTSSPEDWENLFSTNLYEDVKGKTIIEPMFSNRVAMTSRTLVFPYNPDAGLAEWVPDSQYKTAGTVTDPNSTGALAGQTHLVKDNVLKAEKLASKEFIGYEEEEDSIIALTPIIRDAVMRRMVRSTDMELLRGNVGADLGTGNGLIDGISTLAADAVDYDYTQPGTFGSANPVTVADLQQTRRLMGVYGLTPGDITYIVSQTVMYDLMDDPDFRTMDLVGDRATIIRGQIGSINGSPVVVSDSFAAYATGTVQAVALNSSNYLFGELRGMMVERDRDIVNQSNVIVATRRFAFSEIVPAVDNGGRSSCANLVTA